MPNPFSYLQNHREDKEREVHRQLEAEKRAKEQEQEREAQKREQRIAAAESIDGMVTGVLNRLQEAFYPNCSVRSDTRSLDTSWSIGEEWGADYGTVWSSRVKVSLNFDNLDRPTGFSCYRPGGYEKKRLWDWVQVEFGSVECILSEKDLTSALIKLHPPEALGKEKY